MLKCKLLTYSTTHEGKSNLYLMCHEFIPAFADLRNDDESFDFTSEGYDDMKRMIISNDKYLERIQGKFVACKKPRQDCDWVNYAIWKLCEIMCNEKITSNVAVVYDEKSKDLVTLRF